MADTGASVAILSAVLNDTQLADVRKAAAEHISDRGVGKEAMKGLAALPDRNPAALQAFIDTHYPGLEVKRDNNGHDCRLDSDENFTSCVLMGEVKVK